MFAKADTHISAVRLGIIRARYSDTCPRINVKGLMPNIGIRHNCESLATGIVIKAGQTQRVE